MLQFIIGMIIGGTIGFGVCAFLTVANEDRCEKYPPEKEKGTCDVHDES